MSNLIQLTLNGASPYERTLIIGNAHKSNLKVSPYMRAKLSSAILQISSSDLLQFLGNRKDRRLDVPRFELKLNPSKITFKVPKNVYEKIHSLSVELDVSKSVIVHTLYFKVINN